MPSPGFVFWGLFIIIGLIILAYGVWLVSLSRNDS